MNYIGIEARPKGQAIGIPLGEVHGGIPIFSLSVVLVVLRVSNTRALALLYALDYHWVYQSSWLLGE